MRLSVCGALLLLSIRLPEELLQACLVWARGCSIQAIVQFASAHQAYRAAAAGQRTDRPLGQALADVFAN